MWGALCPTNMVRSKALARAAAAAAQRSLASYYPAAGSSRCLEGHNAWQQQVRFLNVHEYQVQFGKFLVSSVFQLDARDLCPAGTVGGCIP